MSISASLVKIINDTPLHNASVVSRGQKISASDILLNGNKISISGNFHDIAKQINRFKARTGVTAEIHITKGRERLVLKTDKPKLFIVDKAGIIAGYFRSNKMGVGADKLIEIAGKNKKITPVFVYSRHETRRMEKLLSHNISGDNIVYLSSLIRNPEIPQILLENNIEEVLEFDEVPELVEIEISSRSDESEELDEREESEDPTAEQIRSKMKALLMEAQKQVAEKIAKDAILILGKNSKKIANNPKELMDSIQNNLIGSDLGEAHLRKNFDKIVQEIAKAIYYRKGFFLISSTYKLQQNEINEAICAAIETVKLEKFISFANSVVEPLKNKEGYNISAPDLKIIKDAITNGLKKMQYIVFKDFCHDSESIRKWVSSEILTKAADQKSIRSKKIVLSSNDAKVLSRRLSTITTEDYQMA